MKLIRNILEKLTHRNRAITAHESAQSIEDSSRDIYEAVIALAGKTDNLEALSHMMPALRSFTRNAGALGVSGDAMDTLEKYVTLMRSKAVGKAIDELQLKKLRDRLAKNQIR